MSNLSPIQPTKLLRRINERLVMRMIRDRGPSTRAEMSKSIGITFPTVIKAVSSLLDSKLLEEFEESTLGPGRPAKRLRLASEDSQVIGVTLSDTECVIASAGLDGVIADDCSRIFPTPPNYESLLAQISNLAKELVLQEEKATLCLGVSIPGIVDYKEQRAVLSANLPLLNGKFIGRDLQALLDVECLILRDAHAFSLSERLLHGNEEVNSNVAMLDHSEGIGLGMMVNNQFLSGNNGFAGELGHISIVADGIVCNCGKKGCLETVASEWALEMKTTQVLGRPIKLKELLELAKSGDEQVQKELEQMCEYLALGVACVINIFNPGKFYVYGQCFRELPYLLDLLVEKTKQYALEPSYSACEFAHACGGELDGTIASVINYLTDSLVPDLDDYAGIAEA
jgi:predicted NBD/HSP70 family sugar kinase